MFLEMVPAELLQRQDITLRAFHSVGLSANRNNALSSCRTPLAVILDDDTPYSFEMLDEIITAFRHAPNLDILTFGDNRLAFRMSTRTPHFDTRFGIGSEYLSCGEEEVLLHQAKVHQLNIRRQEIAAYPVQQRVWCLTSDDVRVRRSWGALQYMKHTTVMSFLRIIGKSLTVDIPDSRGYAVKRRWDILRDMLDGLNYILTHPLNDSVAEEIPLDFQPIDIWRMP